MRWITFTLLLLSVSAVGRAQSDICFRVNMEDALDRELFVPADGDRVVLRGSFENWEGDRFELTDGDGDGVYKGVFTLPGKPGSEIEYKYVIRKSGGQVCWEWQPDPDNPPFGNRRLTLTGNPQNEPIGDFIIDRYDLAAVDMPVMFSVEELRADFAEMRRVLEEKHCCLYDVTDRKDFEQLLAKQEKMIDRPMQPHEFYHVLAPIAAAVGCGHTSLWMSEAFWTHAQDHLFPLRITMMDGYPVVTDYYGEAREVPVGSILLKINGRAVDEIIDELASLYTADARNRNFRMAQVERRFPMLYARAYGFPSKWDVTYALPGRKTSAAAVLEGAGIDAVRAKVFPKPELRFTVHEQPEAAVMRISSFSFYDRVPMFRSYLDSCFQIIDERGIGALVLDLRGNDGGDPFCAAPLLAYLEEEPVPYFARPYGKYAELADPVPLAESPFRGTLIVLIDGSNFSTSAHFCALLKSHGIGTLVGTETGGTFTCNAATDEVHLDHTRLLLFVPTQSFAAAVDNLDRRRGVEPDHQVSQQYKEFLDGRDTVMDYAMRLVRDR